jgi:hypothetical protein
MNIPSCPVGVSLFTDSAIIREEFSSLISFWPMPWQAVAAAVPPEADKYTALTGCQHVFLRPDKTAIIVRST